MNMKNNAGQCMMALALALVCFSTAASAQLVAPATTLEVVPIAPVPVTPCGNAVTMGGPQHIYNKSSLDWFVYFTTVDHTIQWFANANAGIVKYLDNGKWIEAGTGDYRYSMTFKIPVAAKHVVDIAYCPDTVTMLDLKHLGTSRHRMIKGRVDYGLQSGKVIFPGAEFFGYDSAPTFTDAPRLSVAFDVDADGRAEKGSMVIKY